MCREERKTIFIDLDDTIADTFGLLITPLERAAAEAICQIDDIPFSAERLTDILLELRKRTPAELRDKLAGLSTSDADRVLEARDQIFSDFSVSELTISTDVIEVIKSLTLNYKLVLVSEGREEIQKEKIRHLGAELPMAIQALVGQA